MPAWFTRRPKWQRIALTLFGLWFTVQFAINIATASPSSTEFDCGALMDEIQRQAYAETGLPATEFELDYAREQSC